MNRLFTFTCLCLAFVGSTAVAQNANDDGLTIQAQSLASALREFSVRTGLQIGYAAELADGKATDGVEGIGDPETALDTLLASSGLEHRFVNDSTVIIRETAVTDDAGGDREPKSASPTPVLMAQNQTAPRSRRSSSRSESRNAGEEGKPEGEALEEIIVTGTTLRGVENPTVPILSFDREDIALSGATTVEDFLRTIPQNFASETQLSADSANPNNARNNFTQGTTVDLRGLGAGSTLTLLNGRRMTASGNTSNVDVNVLPLGLIERVEVLIDGATAVYGSDAVGGVINFITRKDYEGFDISARYGTVAEGSGEDVAVGAAGGFNWSSGGAFIGADYQERTPLLVAERDFVDIDVARDGATFGSDMERFSVGGGLHQDLGSKFRIGVDALLSDLTSVASQVFPAFENTNRSEQEATFANVRFEYDINDDFTASVFVDYGRNEADTSIVNAAFGDFEFFNNFENELLASEVRVSGSLLDVPGGAVSFSVGGLYREEKYARATFNTLVPDFVLTTDGDRDIIAGYAEFLVPIFGEPNALRFVQKLELSIAGRYEDYSDFGHSLDPKIGFHWAVTENFALRTSYTEAFRAPDLESLHEPQSFSVQARPVSLFTSTALTLPEPGGVDPFGNPAIITLSPIGGNPELSPESATSWSTGFAYSPYFIDDLVIRANYFRIEYEDRLEAVNLFDPIQDPAFVSLVDIPPSLTEVEGVFARAVAGEFELFNLANASPEEVQAILRSGFQNIALRDISGFDVNVNYSTESKFGRVAAGVNMTYFLDYIAQVTDLAPTSEQVNTLYRPIDLRLRGNVSWSGNGFTAFTAVNYTDGYRNNIDPDVANTIESWTTVDLTFAYDTGNRFGSRLADSLRLGISITNLLDEDPPFVATEDGLNFDTANANPYGRQFTVTLSKAF